MIAGYIGNIRRIRWCKIDDHHCCPKIYNLFVHALETGRKPSFYEIVCCVSQRMQMNYIFSDNV